MTTDTVITILVAVAIAAASVWAVEQLAERRSRRDRLLNAIDQTTRQMVAIMGDAAATLAGPGAEKPGRFDADAYPKADARLVGDISVLRTFYGVLADLQSRAPGSGFRVSDAEKVAAASSQIVGALAAQETRVLAHQPVQSLSGPEVEELGSLQHAVTVAIRASSMADDALQGRV
jgi:hypothetical protein